jgi:hypothetical protein
MAVKIRFAKTTPWKMMRLWLFFLKVSLLLGVFPVCWSYQQCPPEEGGGICPDFSTCCPTEVLGQSSCISVKPGEPKGICCSDIKGGLGSTGCPSGYECKRGRASPFRSNRDRYCHRVDPDYHGPKPKPLVLPRYKLITLPRTVMTHVYGLPVVVAEKEETKRKLRRLSNNNDNSNDHDTNDTNDNDTKHVAYFSTMGSLDSSTPQDVANHQRVTTVLIMVHGSGRTAEDYLYGAASSLPKDQQDPNNATMLVLSPWFLDPDDAISETETETEKTEHEKDYSKTDAHEDIPVSSTVKKSSSTNDNNIPIPLPPNTLRWYENGPTISHTWRYGANAINSTVSSFAAIDLMVEKLLLLANKSDRFPSLERILVAGHSAGGQFVQRWALLSNSKVWQPSSSPNNNTNNNGINIRVIPANPRCFAYLDERRFVRDNSSGKTLFQRPNDDVIASCPDYNEWIWGLEEGGDIAVPYKDQAMAKAGGPQAMAHRYVTRRRLIYIAGGEDLEIFDDDCGSVFQGQTRLERSHAYIMSLLRVFPQEMKRSKKHTRLVVPGVPHDHMLMFQSPEGQEALFGEQNDTEEKAESIELEGQAFGLEMMS